MKKNIIFTSLQLLIGVLAIIAYFNHWKELFYVLSSIIAFVWTILLIAYLWASDSIRQKIYYIVITFIYWEVGYLVTHSILDGLLFGISFSPIIGVLENLFRSMRKKNKENSN